MKTEFKPMLRFAAAAMLAAPLGAQATLHYFSIELDQAQEIAASSTTVPLPAGKRAPVPSIPSSAYGTGLAVYDDVANVFTEIYVTAVGLRGAVTDQHIHIGAPGVSGGVALNMPAPAENSFGMAAFTGTNVGNGTVGTTSGATVRFFVDAAEEAAIIAGNSYFNIHTVYDGAGEIRGQLVPIPEPETYALMLAGLGLVGWAAARRRKVGV